MRTRSLAATTAAFAAAMHISTASATELKGVGSNGWQGFPQSAAGGSPNAAPRAPHYEWQYHYVGRHGRYEGYWLLVR